jgi:hypothetical protein
MKDILKWLVPLAFIAHGIGMVGGTYFVFTSKSWFGDAFGGALLVARIITALIWVVTGVAFVAAGWGYWQGMDWWRTAAWIAAPASVVGIALWAGPIPPGTYVGGLMSLAVIVALALGW